MQKNKLAILIALALVFSPMLSVQAEKGSSDGSVDVKTDSDIRPLPPTRDPKFPKLRSTDDGKDMPRPGVVKFMDKKDDSTDDMDDDKGGLRMKEEGRMRKDLKSSTDDDNRPELTDEQKAEMKKKYEVRKAELKSKIETRKGEIKIKLEDKAKERVKNILANMWKMLNNQLDRLSKADARIGEKLASLKEKGLDVSKASAQYTVAQTALAKAKLDVEATSSLSSEQAETDTSKETLRSLVKTASDSIKSAGAEYRKIFPLMPKEPVKVEVETSTSASTSVTE
jgi:rRNA maturation endonuclease Nob1